MKKSELVSIIKEVIEESKSSKNKLADVVIAKRKSVSEDEDQVFEEGISKDDWSIFTTDVLAKLESLDLGESKDFLTDLLESSKMKSANKSKVETLIETANTKKKILQGAYDFKLASLGLTTIK